MNGEKYTLGAGKAKVTIEITRPDATVDRVTIDSVILRDHEAGTFAVTHDDSMDLLSKHMDQVFRSPQMELELVLDGQVLAADDGVYFKIEKGVSS